MGFFERARFGANRSEGNRHRWHLKLLLVLAVFALGASACSGSDDTAAGFSDESSEDGDDSDGSARSQGSEETDDGFDQDDDAAQEEPAGDVDTGVEASASAPTTVARSDGEDAEIEAPTAAPADSDADGPLGAGGTRVTPTAADLGRKLIFTAFVNVEVDDVAAASAEATSIIEDMGGFLFGQNTTGGSQAQSELTFKVRPADFNIALERLGSVGELRNQSVTTDDVTERIVDLDSRIQVADLGVARLRAALEGSQSLEDYAEIERLLLDRESDLEVMRGQLRTLQDRVDLSTITLILSQDSVDNAIDVQISAYRDHDDGASCPGESLRSVEAGSEVTLCFEIINTGDQTLTNITLTDSVLEIDAETELLEVFGSLDELAPGQSALVAWQIKPERDLRLRTRVTAIPTDGVSSEQAGPSVSRQPEFSISTFEPDTDPGFGDGFSAAVSILKGIWVAFRVTVGFLLPLLILTPLLWVAWRGFSSWRRRRPARSAPVQQSGQGGQPPPPNPGVGGSYPGVPSPGGAQREGSGPDGGVQPQGD